MGFYHDHCIYLPAMAGWFFFSALLSSYNKLVFGSGHMAFPCPLLLTSLHFFVQWIFSWALSSIFPRTFGGDQVAEMAWKPFLGVSIPCGLVTSGDVGLSNLSLVRISITFYTMVKASTPIFVLAWAYMLGIEQITWSLLGVVLIIALGEFLTVVGEVHFDVVGFLLCLSASVLSGARWTLVQLKLHTMEPPLKTTIATMRVLSPSMFFSMLFISLLVEKPWISLAQGDYFHTVGEAFSTLGMGLIGASFAVAMIICEFYLIMRANAIVLMIGGVIKEMITIIVGVEFFHDTLNEINVVGCLIVFTGVILYKVTHHLDKNGGEKGHEGENGESLPNGGRVRYRPVDGSSQHNSEISEEDGLWMKRIPVELLQHDPKSSLVVETEAVGIQMSLPNVQVDNDETGVDDENEDEDDEESDSPIRRRLT